MDSCEDGLRTPIEMARQILSALGDEIFLEDEYYLDMATALSGTGPAYVFLIHGGYG